MNQAKIKISKPITTPSGWEIDEEVMGTYPVVHAIRDMDFMSIDKNEECLGIDLPSIDCARGHHSGVHGARVSNERCVERIYFSYWEIEEEPGLELLNEEGI